MASIINATTTAGVSVAGDNSGSLQLATNNGTTAVTIDTSQTTTINSPSSTPLIVQSAGTERMRITSAGDVGIGTSSPSGKLEVSGGQLRVTASSASSMFLVNPSTTYADGVDLQATYNGGGSFGPLKFTTSGTERMRVDSSGNLLVGKTAGDGAVQGCEVRGDGWVLCTRPNGQPLFVNRLNDDGVLVDLRQDTTQEGTISVSGSTVSYNGGHLSRWSQLPDGSKDETILKGTVLTNLDDMCVWTKDGTVLDNEQLNKMKVSDVEGDINVAGVFVNWTRDEDCQSDDMNVAMTGDMIIRIAEGVVVQKGNLLMSAGDGTAKPQGDDIVRSKTIAKVTSNHVTCTYADGSYCVPCVLMAC
jgi:hypothetical protein